MQQVIRHSKNPILRHSASRPSSIEVPPGPTTVVFCILKVPLQRHSSSLPERHPAATLTHGLVCLRATQRKKMKAPQQHRMRFATAKMQRQQDPKRSAAAPKSLQTCGTLLSRMPVSSLPPSAHSGAACLPCLQQPLPPSHLSLDTASPTS